MLVLLEAQPVAGRDLVGTLGAGLQPALHRGTQIGVAAQSLREAHVAEPWAGYDEMRLDEILARLEDATEVELAVVSAYEREHEARQAILLAAGESA